MSERGNVEEKELKRTIPGTTQGMLDMVAWQRSEFNFDDQI